MRNLIKVILTLLIITILSLCIPKTHGNHDRTHSESFSYEMEMSMRMYAYEQHAKEMDRANECREALGTYSMIMCDIWERNKKHLQK